MSRTAEATPQVDLPDHAGSELQPVSMAAAVGYPAIECASERRAERGLVLKHDRLFMLADPHGNIAAFGDFTDDLQFSELAAGHFKVDFIHMKIQEFGKHRFIDAWTDSPRFVVAEAEVS